MAPRQMNQNGIGVADAIFAILKNGNALPGIDPSEVRREMLTSGMNVDLDRRVGDAKQRAKQPNLVAVGR